MLEECISSAGTGALIQVDRKMNRIYYPSILMQNLKDFAKTKNNRDISRKQWLNHSKLKVLELPSRSPDLNPIQYLWGDLKRDVHRRCPPNWAVNIYKEE